MTLLPPSFFLRNDVVQIARELLGKKIITRFDGVTTSGIISETEAYAGVTDRASHAYGGRRTARTEVMYAAGGTAYVYLCYGMHSLFNIVTNEAGIPHAVLIRGIIPLEGTEIMLQRTGKTKFIRDSGIGPGKVSKLLGIHYSHSGLLLNQAYHPGNYSISLEETGTGASPGKITTCPRVGVDYAGADALLPYRFILQRNN
ncbi:MAG: DNA-3-methyladenine glycosylase [Bacteroidota bacterium]